MHKPGYSMFGFYIYNIQYTIQYNTIYNIQYTIYHIQYTLYVQYTLQIYIHQGEYRISSWALFSQATLAIHLLFILLIKLFCRIRLDANLYIC